MMWAKRYKIKLIQSKTVNEKHTVPLEHSERRDEKKLKRKILSQKKKYRG